MEQIPKSTKLVSLGEISESLQTNELVVLDFSAVWCGPCQQLYPDLVKLATRLSNVCFYKVDVSDEDGAELSDQFEIGCLPTVCFFYQGELVDRLEGYNPSDITLITTLSKYLFKYDKSRTTCLESIVQELSKCIYGIPNSDENRTEEVVDLEVRVQEEVDTNIALDNNDIESEKSTNGKPKEDDTTSSVTSSA